MTPTNAFGKPLITSTIHPPQPQSALKTPTTPQTLHYSLSQSIIVTAPTVDLTMSHSSLDSPTEILRSAILPPPYTPPLLTQLSHEQKLQWREEAKDLMDTMLDKWTYPSVPLTAIEDIRNSAKIATRLAKIWALAQLDPTQRDLADVKYHMEHLWHHFENANKATATHSQAAWEYPLNLASQLYEKLDKEPGRSTVDIVVHKFQHL